MRPGGRADTLAMAAAPTHSPAQRAARDALREALNAQQAERDRHDFLTMGQRSQRELFDANAALAEARQTLLELKRVVPADLAYAYAAGDTISNRQSLAEAEAAVTRDESRVAHLHEVEAALAGKIAESAAAQTATAAGNQALGAVLSQSPQFGELCHAIEQAWAHLRTLRLAFGVIQKAAKAAHGNLPTNIERRATASQPLAEDIVGFDQFDHAYVDRWKSCLARLTQDPDVALPGLESPSLYPT
jgi:hypothetical protein